VDDPAGLKAITAISVDKHTRGRITARRPVRLMIVGRTPGRPPRLLGLVKGLFWHCAGWRAARAGRPGSSPARLDPLRGYLTALVDQLAQS